MPAGRGVARAVVFRVYGVFALLLIAAVAFVELCESYDAREAAIEARSWDTANNRWNPGYDWRASVRTDRRLRAARLALALGVLAAAAASSVASAVYASQRPAHWPAYALAALAFAAIAVVLGLSLAVAGAVGGGGMIGATAAARGGVA
jgi:hypothetical protein